MKYFKVSFEYSENIYCTNIAVAECKEDVEKHYSEYTWVSVKDAEDREVEEAERKGMPIVTVEHAEPEQAAEQEPETEQEQEQETETETETDGPHIYGTMFYGNEVSEYGRENGYVDYATLAKSFDAVLNNDIMSATAGAGFYWDQVSGYIDNSERIEELQEAAEDAEDAGDTETAERLNEEIEELQEEQDRQPEIFQWYIVSDQGAEILKWAGEIVFYNQDLDMYIWGVTHYGTGWTHVLTNIKCNTGRW